MVATYQVTLGSAATQVSATPVNARQVIFQNNSAANCRIGDNQVTTVGNGRGILLSAGSPGGSLNAGSLVAFNVNLADWYIYGTVGSVIDALVID